jgi:hypothetical protein
MTVTMTLAKVTMTITEHVARMIMTYGRVLLALFSTVLRLYGHTFHCGDVH